MTELSSTGISSKDTTLNEVILMAWKNKYILQGVVIWEFCCNSRLSSCNILAYVFCLSSITQFTFQLLVSLHRHGKIALHMSVGMSIGSYGKSPSSCCLLYPRKEVRGYTGITTSVCPSVCPAAFGFLAHNCFPFTPIIMKLHMQTPHAHSPWVKNVPYGFWGQNVKGQGHNA